MSDTVRAHVKPGQGTIPHSLKENSRRKGWQDNKQDAGHVARLASNLCVKKLKFRRTRSLASGKVGIGISSVLILKLEFHRLQEPGIPNQPLV